MPAFLKTMTRTITALLFLALPASLVGQDAGVAFDRSSRAPTLPELHLPTPRAAATGLIHQLVRAAGGAAVGAWVGYMVSQVAVGDWDDDVEIDRGTWTAGGAAVGLTLGLSIRSGRVPPAGVAAVEADDRAPSRDVLTTEQIRRAHSGDLYQLIQALRPEWLRTRGTGSMRETARGSADGLGEVEIAVQPGIPSIRVYLDDSLLGDVDALRGVDPGMIGQARFLDAAQATQRWGAGHIHGAILVETAAVQ